MSPWNFHLNECVYEWLYEKMNERYIIFVYVVIELLSCLQLFASPWSVACEISLSFTISQNLLKLMSIHLMMPFNHFNVCYPLLILPSIIFRIRDFSSELALHISWPNIWASASVSVLPMNIQDWFSLRFTGLISVQSKGFIRAQKHQLFRAQPSLWYNSHIWT